MKYFILLLLPLIAFAQDPMQLTEEELNPEAEEILIKKPEKYLRNESMIYDFDTDLGIKDQRQYTGQDRNKISFAGHVSGNYEHFNNLLGAEFSYMHRSTRYNQIWYGFQAFQHNATFDTVSTNRTPSTGVNVNDESNFHRPGDAKNTILGLGLGVGYRFKLLLDFFQTEDTFESIDVFANSIRFNESFIKKEYTGYGLTTNYGLHKRVNTSFFYGGKLSYNLAAVKRQKLGTESDSGRSLSLGWLSLAFELGFFF
jgi:hypothetical protein